MILAVIPARGGSKGIPGKNIKDLYGQPLISYTIQAALDCKKIDRVVVSTDSEEIAGVAKKYGADVPFLRPAALAMDTSKTIDAVIDVLERLQETYEYVVLLQPTSPLRTAEDIEKAIDKAVTSGKDVASVSLVKEHAGDWYGWRISAVTVRRKYHPQTGYERNLPGEWCGICKSCSRLDKEYQF